MTLLESAKELVLRRAEACGDLNEVKRLIEPLGGLDPAGPRDPMQLALVLAAIGAVHDGLLTSSISRLDEEHQTAAFMGHLVTNLRWFLLVQSTSRGGVPAEDLPEVSWAYQSRSDEAKSGADFGLVVRPRDTEFCRVSLFQAKVDKLVSTRSHPKIDVSRSSGGARKAARRPHRNYDWRCLEVAAWQDETPPDAWGRPNLDSFSWGEGDSTFQIEALIKSQFAGVDVATAPARWCHYVAWPSGKPCRLKEVGGPKVASVLEAARDVMSRPELRRGRTMSPRALSTFHVRRSDNTLLRVLASILTGQGLGDAVGPYVQIPFGRVRAMFERVAGLLPDLQLMLVDEEEGGGLRKEMEAGGWLFSEGTSQSPEAEPSITPRPGS